LGRQASAQLAAAVGLYSRNAETGLQVKASLNRKQYKTKIKVSDQEMKCLNLKRHKVCPNWNYTITPRLQP